MANPLSFDERSVQLSVMEFDDTAEKERLPGAVGTGGVNVYVCPLAGLDEMLLVEVNELTVGEVPKLLKDLKFPDPVPAAVIPTLAEGDTRKPVSRLVRYTNVIRPVAS